MQVRIWVTGSWDRRLLGQDKFIESGSEYRSLKLGMGFCSSIREMIDNYIGSVCL